MANITCYFGIEILNMTNPQKSTLITGLQGLGVNNNSNKPNERNHWRIRLDNNAAIFEALFDEDTLTIDAIKARLANIFNIDVGTITHNVNQTAYGAVVTFIQGGQNRIRSVAYGFDGGWPTWNVSRLAAKQYLIDNALAWSPAE